MQSRLNKIIKNCFPSAEISRSVGASGGDIHRSFVLDLAGSSDVPSRVFVKTNSLLNAAVLESEFESLRVFAGHPFLNYPTPLWFESDDQTAYLLMDYHSIDSLDVNSAEKLGLMLAQQHQITNADFGWHQQNYIGLTPQLNQSESKWAVFFRRHRLEPQIQAAAKNGLAEALCRQAASLCGQLEALLADQNPQPALLHGDLWSGNAGYDSRHNMAILFDPAPYFGAAEADLAMTELFGRFPQSFYQAYYSVLPEQAGYAVRRPVYNLYHALNHFNLFGAGYTPMLENQLRMVELAQHTK